MFPNPAYDVSGANGSQDKVVTRLKQDLQPPIILGSSVHPEELCGPAEKGLRPPSLASPNNKLLGLFCSPHPTPPCCFNFLDQNISYIQIYNIHISCNKEQMDSLSAHTALPFASITPLLVFR